jgi:DNA-binding beta-propeller fold protein YncE
MDIHRFPPVRGHADPERQGPGRRLRGAALVLALLVGAIVLPITRAAAAFAVPSQVRSIGGTGRASVFPWGLAHDPVSGELIVTDYLNYQIRRYALDGTYLGDLPQPSGADGDPESVLAAVAVDPRNGDIYVGKPKPDTLAHYTAAGERLPDITVDPGSGTQTYTAWLAIDGDGYLYVLDSHLWNTAADPSRLIKLSPGGGSQVAVWDLVFPNQGATQSYGIDVASDGRIYLSDSINRRVQILGPDGSYLGSIGSAGGPEVVGGLSGDLRSVVVDDAAGRLYVIDAIQDQVEVFSLDGAPLFHVGGEGAGPGDLLAPRQLALDGDGRLWVSEYGNYRLQSFDAAGAPLETIPAPSAAPPPGQLGQPRDVTVDPATGNVWVVDTWNQRFQAFGPDGGLLGTWGNRGNSPPYGVKYPRGIGFDPVNRRVWVTNHAAGTIYVYDDQANFLFQLGAEANRHNGQPGFFEKPGAVAFGSGYAYVADNGGTYEGNSPRVKILDAMSGTEVGWIARNSRGIAIDQATGNVYVADTGQQKIFVYPPGGGTALFSFGGRGTANGKFQGIWGLTISGGVLYAADDTASRIQAFTTSGTFIGKWGGYGSNPYQLRNPSGMASDAAGRLYVADSTNDRVVVFDPVTPKPAYEFSRPKVTVTGPAQGAFLDGPAVITGTATDNRAIANVEIAVRDDATGLWWEPTTATWRSTQSWALAPWSGASPTTVAWSWSFGGARFGGSYHAEVRARDTNNTMSAPVAAVDFHVVEPIVDVAPPQTTLDDPSGGAILPVGPVAVSGNAMDDVGIAQVRVAVQHTATGQWWTGGGWSQAETWHLATVASPGSASTGWTWPWSPPAAGGYTFLASAVDLASNVDDSPASAAVTLDPGAPDTTAADGTISWPSNNQVLPFGPVTFAGAATDDVGVANVGVAIKDRTTGQWWNAASGRWVTSFRWNPGAALGTPGASPTGWTFGWTPPAPGAYAVTVQAQDAAGNCDATRPWVNFSVA